MKLLISSIVIAVLMGGCFQSESKNEEKTNNEIIENTKNIDFVKNGVMEFDKTLTVEQAFSSWEHCSNKQWTNFKTDNGKKIIQFECNNNTIDKFIKNNKELSQETLEYLNILDTKLKVQWTLNVDNTFQLYNLNEEMKWKNGFIFNNNINATFLTKVYNNKSYFENTFYDKEKMKFYANEFYKNFKTKIIKKKNIEKNKIESKQLEKDFINNYKKQFKEKNLKFYDKISNVTNIDDLYNVIKDKKIRKDYFLKTIIFYMETDDPIVYLPISKRLVDLILEDKDFNTQMPVFTDFIFYNTNPSWGSPESIKKDKYLANIVDYILQYPKTTNMMKVDLTNQGRSIFHFSLLFDRHAKNAIDTYIKLIDNDVLPTAEELSGFETNEYLKNNELKLYNKLVKIKDNYLNENGNDLININNTLEYQLNKKLIINFKVTLNDYFKHLVNYNIASKVPNDWIKKYSNKSIKAVSKKAIDELLVSIKPKFKMNDIKIEFQ